MHSAFFIFLVFISSLSLAANQPLDFSHSREWLRLLHFDHGKSLVHTMIGKDDFFLAPDGATNPTSELQATVGKMFHSLSDVEQKTQCRFLARRDFLLRHWSEIEPSTNIQAKLKIQDCPEATAWLKKLGADSVSLIFATAYLNSAPSSFGHTFLKIHNAKNDSGKDLLDYGINFAARTADTRGALYAMYGLLGYFPGTYAMVPYHQMIKDYTHLEGRDIWEYELSLTPEETHRLIYHLLELDGTYFDYYFSNRNCSWAIARALEIARPDLDLNTHQDFEVIPLDSLKVVTRTPGLVKKIKYRPSEETEWISKERSLSDKDRADVQKLFAAAKKGKFSEQDLSTVSVEALDAAMDLFTLKGYEDHKKFDQPQFLLLGERAKRKAAALSANQAAEDLMATKIPPSKSPDSSTLQLGLNELHNPNEQNSEAWVGIRILFHDLLSEDQGVSPWSHLEFMSAKLYRSNHQQTQIGHYRILEILSTQASSWYAGPFSWGTSVGGDRELLAPTRMHSYAKAKVGYSFDLLENLRWINLLEAGVMQNLSGDGSAVFGLQSMAVAKFGRLFRAEIGFEDLHLQSQERRHEITSQVVMSPWLQWELRAGWREEDLWQGQSLETSTETSISVEHHWIF